MPPTAVAARIDSGSDSPRLLSAQLRLLYANANVGVAVTVTAAAILGCLQWNAVSRPRILFWWLYVFLVAGFRSGLTWRFRQASAFPAKAEKYRIAFAVGVALAGAGWGFAGVLLYPEGHLGNQVVLLYVLGGMMLGASSLLAPRPEAYLAFLLPAGTIPSIRLLVTGDRTHIAMGLLAGVFTLVTVITTRRAHRMITSSLRLQFENDELVEELRSANQRTETLNQALEQRVLERTAELQLSTEQLKAEVAQRQQTEEELLRARKLESLGVLAGGIAHDFNNFLTVVQGNIEVAKASLAENEPAQALLDQATNACQRAKFLSSQLLTFAKGGAPIRRVASIAQLLTDAVQLARTGSSVGIDVSIADGLWSAEIDPGQIGQVFHNILLNAREATLTGSPIEVRASNVAPTTDLSPGEASPGEADPGEAGPRVRVTIRDRGIGMPPEVLRRIFDPYFTTKPGGTGLGLATAYAIVVKHGGQITAQSTPGVGTKFTVDLPATTQPAPSADTVSKPLQAGNERLLVMDDDPSLRILSEAVLSHLGYQVQTAVDGGQALELYQQAQAEGKPFDAVLLDLTVTGGMGGVEAATRLKAFDPTARLVVSSGYSDAPVMSHFEDYGFEAVIEKPWTVQQMSEILRTVLSGGRMQNT